MKCRQLATKLSIELTKTKLWIQTGTKSTRWSWGAVDSLGPLITLMRLGPIRFGCPSWRRCPCGCPVVQPAACRCPCRNCYYFSLVVFYNVSAQIESNQNSSNIWHNLIQVPTAADGRKPSVSKAAEKHLERPLRIHWEKSMYVFLFKIFYNIIISFGKWGLKIITFRITNI